MMLKFTKEGEVFYLQKRIGSNKKPFSIIKFATMLKDSPNMEGGYATVRNDARVTKLGRILRMTKLNEITQLINVLKGDMTLVGPRPLIPQSFQNYPSDIRDKIYLVKPGITGIGSIVFRDEEKIITKVRQQGRDSKKYYKEQILPYKGQLEIWYQKHLGPITDLKILILTALSILYPKKPFHNLFFKNLPKEN